MPELHEGCRRLFAAPPVIMVRTPWAFNAYLVRVLKIWVLGILRRLVINVARIIRK